MSLTINYSDLLENLPASWLTRRNAIIFKENKEIVGTASADYKVLALSLKGVIERDIESGYGKFPESFDGYQIIDKNSLLLCLFDVDVTPRISGYVNQRGITSAAYTNLIARNKANLKYYYYWFLTLETKKVLLSYCTGLRISLKDNDFKNLSAPVPPLEAQNKIVEYIDKKIAKIDLFINNKQQFIGKLIERKQSIINDAVTSGSSSDQTTKPSNIAWLGDIPSDWETLPMKYLASINTTALSDKTDPDKELLYVDIGSVNSDGEVEKKESFKFRDAPSRARRVVSDGDTIISTVRTYLRAIGYIHQPEENLVVSTGFAVCTPRTKLIDKEFLQYAVRSNYFIEKVVSNSYGVSYPAITAEKLGCHKIALPKTIEEQQLIVSLIKSETAVIDQAIEKAKHQVTLIKEYRDSLITHAVTGQIEIKE